MSWWRAEGDATDAVGVNNGETPFGISYVPGKVGTSFSFNGQRTRVSVPDNPSFKLTASLSIEGWINIAADGGFILFRGDDRPGLDPYALTLSDNSGHISFHIGSPTSAVDLEAPIAYQEWKHVAATLDDATGDMKIYVDGALVAQTNTTLRPFADLDPAYEPALGIGDHGGTFHWFTFTGLIDEISLYSRALSAAEVQSLFAAGSTGKCLLPNVSGPPVIASFQPGQAEPGAIITISGQNFSPSPGKNKVFFGPVRASVLAASSTNLTVSVPGGATYAPINVTIRGLTGTSPKHFLPVFAGKGGAIDVSSFAPRFDLTATNGPLHVVLSDLNGDGRPDLVVANAYAHSIYVYQNVNPPGQPLSPGSFMAPIILPVGGGTDNPYRFTVADVDGDGKPDLVVPDRHANVIYIFRNQCGSGYMDYNSFAPPISFASAADVRDVAVRDIDGDGKPEIVTANYGSGTISILRHGPAGPFSTNSFEAPFELPAGQGTYAVAIGDLDGDSLPDIAALNSEANTVSVYRNPGWVGDIPAEPVPDKVDLPALAGATMLGLADLDGDGKTELVLCSYLAEVISVYHNIATPGQLNLNSFDARVDFPANGWSHTLGFGDFNGDGKVDIGLVTELPSHFSVFQNRATSTVFTADSLGPRVDYSSGWNAWGLAVGDLDGDGRPDAVFANAYDATVSIYRNVMPFAFPTAPSITVQPVSRTVEAGATVEFSVTAVGDEPLYYQWRFNGVDLLDRTNSVLTLSHVQPAQDGKYSVRVSNGAGSVESSNAVLTVNPPATELRLGTVANALPDELVSLPVQLVANGTENALGFSIGFSTSQLSFLGFKLNPAIANASLVANTNLAASGSLGLLISVPVGSTFAPGTQELAVVVFRTGRTLDTVMAPLSFADAPVLRQVTDGLGSPLKASFIDGSVTIVSNGLEGDVMPRPDGDKLITVSDWVVLGRYTARIEVPGTDREFQRADTAPRETSGDGELTVSDWVQCGRYASGLDPVQIAGGPNAPVAGQGQAVVPSAPPIMKGPSLRQVRVTTEVGAADQPATLSVLLEAQGDENALGFNLSFDPALLAYEGATLGVGAPGATLEANQAGAAVGQVGFVLALPAGSTFAAGSTQILKATFRMADGASGLLPVNLGSRPVKGEICSAYAAVLDATYVNGGITVEPLPRLGIRVQDNSVILYWPSWASNFVLQTCAPTGTWINSSLKPVVYGESFLVTVPLTGESSWFRLYTVGTGTK